MKNRLHTYYLFEFLANMSFFSPVILLFWKQNGLSMTEIMLLQSFYAVGVSVLELPTGAFADYFGKKTSLLMGALFWAFGCFWYGASHTFWQFIIGETLIGVGSAFLSGADRAYLHQILTERKEVEKFKKVEGRSRGLIQIAQGIGSIVGGFIAPFSIGLTITATGITNLFNFGVGMTLPSIKSKKENTLGFFQIIKESIKLIYIQKEILWLTLFFASFYALVWPMQFYAQLYFKEINLPLYQFGIAYFLFNVIAAFFLNFTHEVEQKTKEYIYVVLSATIVLFLILVGLFQTIYLVPLWSIYIITNFMNQTIISGRVLQLVPPEKAATILSFQSLMRRMIGAIILPFLGIISDMYSLRTTFLLYAGFAFVVLSTLLVLKKRFR